MNFNITIIEDNIQEKERLIDALHLWEEKNKISLHIDYYLSGEDYFSSCATDESNLYILDIQLSGMTGIDVAKKMRERGFDGTLLFLTAFREYVFEGYDVRALHYLLKPVSQEALNKCLDDVHQQIKGDYFVFRDNSHMLQIPYSDIICLSVVKHYIEITTKKEVYSIRMSLKSILPFLPTDFVQCHRGYIVNMRHIRKVTATNIMLSNNTTVQIGRNYLSSLRREYADFSMRFNI